MSDYYAPEPSEFEKKLSMCEELLEYLRRYLPKDARNGRFAKLGNGTFQNGNGHSKNEKNEADYLSSSFFLTEEEEGFYYEKEQERRKQRKKKTKKVKKTLYHPTRIFTFFGLLETFPPTTLADVPASVEYLENYKEKILREEEEKKAKEEEQLRLDLENENEKQEERESIYSSGPSGPTTTFSLPEESQHDDVASSHHDDVSSEFSELRQEIDAATGKEDVAMGEDEDFGDLFA